MCNKYLDYCHGISFFKKKQDDASRDWTWSSLNSTDLKVAPPQIKEMNIERVILLMEGIRRSPGMYKTLYDNGINYQPQLVQDFWTINSRIVLENWWGNKN